MNGEKLSEFYDNRKENFYSRSDTLRFFLMPFVYIVLLGLPGKYGSYISTYSNFVAQVFFILYGFFTLVPDLSVRLERIKKTLKSAVKIFLIMFISHLVLSVLYLLFTNSLSNLFSTASAIKHALFNFFILNVWPLPVGNSIWFVQSLVYALLFFLFAEKTRLNRFYTPILILLAVFTLSTGEFAAFFGFPYHGYYYIPGGAVTRAIPYMLIGMLLRKYVDLLPKIPQYVYLLMFPVGLLAAIGEIEFLRYIGRLVYLGHTVGFGIMALSLCCFVLAKPAKKNGFISNHGRNYSIRMYVLCQPVTLILWILTIVLIPKYFFVVGFFSCIISFVICLVITFAIGMAKFTGFKLIKRRRKVEKNANIFSKNT